MIANASFCWKDNLLHTITIRRLFCANSDFLDDNYPYEEPFEDIYILTITNIFLFILKCLNW